ncbi:uncharacterized protein LOC118733854 [Rhagoletis pomonella]|uniref:uncharacterized protein LOC118733854 n=1 Tax=Rhagoletis pomonella TaxID=28610 RepID=UPI001782A7C8|nr:uncharacterized protein LOC118733854 [Rhagoletis pomonella]
MAEGRIDSASSDSDDGDDEQMRQFLEAADSTLLTNAMFRGSEDCSHVKESLDKKVDVFICEQKAPRSNRYLVEEEVKSDADFITTEAVRKHIAKKLSELIMSRVEFCDFQTLNIAQKPWKSRVTILADAGCYVKSYEEFEFESKGPTKKPVIKKRRIDDPNQAAKQEDLFKEAAVTSKDILSGQLITGWASKRLRKGKVFNYESDCIGNLHLKPEENEFTKIRRKNQWHESKIKRNKNITSR